MLLNGKEFILDSEINLTTLLEKNNFQISKVAVEINGDICPKANFDKVTVSNQDIIEVVSFVGGG